MIPEEAGLTTTKHKVLLLEDTSLPSRGPFRKIPGRTLGTVHSTNVYKVAAPVEVHQFKQFLALKVIKCQIRNRDVEDRKVALREVKNMMPVDHLHIVVYVASFEQMLLGREPREVKIDGRKTVVVKDVVLEYNLGIAMYPAGLCDLSEYMEKIDDNRRHQMFRFFGCLSQAVSYLHSQKIRLKHKDIKPANIIVDSFNQPLLTDFGISKHYRAGEASKSDGWTYKTDKYACPQSTDESERDYRSDVYSLGCVFLEMATVILCEQDFLPKMENFRGAINNKPSYCETLPKVNEWLNKLAASQDADGDLLCSTLVPALEHIRKMLSFELKDRPWADQLWDYFKGLYIYNEQGIMHGIDEKSVGVSSKPCVRCDAQSKKTELEGPVRIDRAEALAKLRRVIHNVALVSRATNNIANHGRTT